MDQLLSGGGGGGNFVLKNPANVEIKKNPLKVAQIKQIPADVGGKNKSCQSLAVV